MKEICLNNDHEKFVGSFVVTNTLISEKLKVQTTKILSQVILILLNSLTQQLPTSKFV